VKRDSSHAFYKNMFEFHFKKKRKAFKEITKENYGFIL